MISQTQQRFLARAALAARKNAYAPYSGFAVGAALLAADGRIFTGCNVENAAYSVCCCAERTALFKAVSEGVRTFAALAVCGAPVGQEPPLPLCTPCGMCRQALIEFCDPDAFEILFVQGETDYACARLSKLLPQAFSPNNLREGE